MERRTPMADSEAPRTESGRGFERHALTVTALTTASRFGGLAREACFSRLIGLTEAASAFGFAFTVPNLFRRLFGEGALSAALIPEQTRLEHRHPEAARRLAAKVLVVLGLGLAALVVVGEVLLAVLPARDADLGTRLLAITLPYVPLVCVTAIAGAVLQVRGRFGPAAAAPILLNASLVGAVLLAWYLGDGEPVEAERIGIVAWGVIVAGVLQAIWTLTELRRTAPSIDVKPEDVVRTRRRVRLSMARVIRQVIPMVIGLGVLQLNTFVDSLIASWPTVVGPTILGWKYPLDDTAMATLGYASRLYEFPLGVFGIAIATAIFPQLAREVASPSTFAATVRRGLRLVMFIGVPASVGVVLVRRSFAEAVFLGGAFSIQDAERVAFVLLGYGVAIWSYSATHLLVRAFYARREHMTAVRVGISMVGLNFALNLILVFGTGLGVSGSAWSTSICAFIQTAVLLRILAGRTGPLLDSVTRASIFESVASAAVMGLAVWSVLTWVPFDLVPGDWLSAFAEVLSAATVGAMVHLGLAGWRRRPELGWALGRVGG